MTSTSNPSIDLVVVEIPDYNRWMYTNKIYVSPATLVALGIPPNEKDPLVLISGYPYVVDTHENLTDGQIIVNSLHRRYMTLDLGTLVSVTYFRAPSNFLLGSIEFSVDRLSSEVTVPPKIDTDRLASNVLKAYQGHPFGKGRDVPIKLNGTQLLLTVKDAQLAKHYFSQHERNIGRLLQSTEIFFSRADGASGFQLAGSLLYPNSQVYEDGLPNRQGRLRILNIHTAEMRKNNLLAPDAVERLAVIAEVSKNFSGAELGALVREATTFALARCSKNFSQPYDLSTFQVEYEDFERGLAYVEPEFESKWKSGAEIKVLKRYLQNGLVSYGASFDHLMGTMESLVEQVRNSLDTPLMSVLLHGPKDSGKTAVAAKVAVDSDFPFVRIISAQDMESCYSDQSKCQIIQKVFTDSYKSPLSLIFIDDLEDIIEYVPYDHSFSKAILQTLKVLLKKVPPNEDHRLLVIGTTSRPQLLEEFGLDEAFDTKWTVPLLEKPPQVHKVLCEAAHMNNRDAASIANAIKEPIGIKHLLKVAGLTQFHSDGDTVDVDVFMEYLRNE